MIEKIPVGVLMQTNCYIVYDKDTKDAIVVDPGYEDNRITDFISKNNLKVKYIYLTHCHFDHIFGVKWLKKCVNAPVICLDKEKDNLMNEDINLGKAILQKPIVIIPDKVVAEGEEIDVGKLKFKVLHTPGHTSGSSSLYGEGILIAGDTLFNGTYGRCDLPTGNLYEMTKTLKEKLFKLPSNTIVYPGHGEETTIGNEKEDIESDL